MVWARISYDDRDARTASQRLEWAWQVSNSLGPEATTLAHTLAVHYSAPDGFCYDAITCGGGTPLIDNPESAEYNAPAQAEKFVKWLKQYSTAYRGSNLLVLFGDDFTAEAAHATLINMDRLMKATNKLQSQFNVTYSTPSRWAKATLTDPSVSFPTRTTDVAPYAE